MPGWIFFAIVMAIAQAFMPMVNEVFKVRAVHLMLWCRIVIIVVLLPVIFLLPAPTDPLFYVFIIGTALCFGYFDLIYIGQAADTGAGSVTRVEGLIVGVTFLIWTAISPITLQGYIENPVRAAGILASLAGSIYFALRMRECEISSRALKGMGPAILFGSTGIVFGKLAMLHSDYHSGVWYYALLQSCYVLVLYMIVNAVPAFARRFPGLGGAAGHGLFSWRVILAGIGTALFWVIHTPAKYYAFKAVENPAYVTLIGLTAPLWVLLIYRIVGRREKADILSGLGVVFCAALLVAFTAF